MSALGIAVGMGTKEPIVLPVHETPAEKWQRRARRWRRRAQARSERLQELLRAARTAEGRRRNLAPLLLLAAAGGLLIGVALGLRKGR